jgi:hypothetical protein
LRRRTSTKRRGFVDVVSTPVVAAASWRGVVDGRSTHDRGLVDQTSTGRRRRVDVRPKTWMGRGQNVDAHELRQQAPAVGPGRAVSSAV